MSAPFDFEKFKKVVDLAVELLRDGVVSTLTGTIREIAEFTVKDVEQLAQALLDYEYYMTMGRVTYERTLHDLRDSLKVRKQMMDYIYDKLIEFIEKELGDEQR